MNRPGRAQRFTGYGFILGLCGLAVLLSPLTKALDLLEDLRISREIHQHALLCFVPGQLSITTKADSRKFELQEKVVTSLPSMPKRPKPGLELYLWDFTRQLLQAHCKTLWVEEQSRVLALVPGCAQMVGVLGDLPWMLAGRVSSARLGSVLSPCPRTGLSSCSQPRNHPMRGSRERGLCYTACERKG